MYTAINYKGEYQEFPYAKTKEEAEQRLREHFTQEEIDREEWEIIEN